MTSCPHCTAANETSSAFCTACGKALPDAVRTGPRVVSEKGFAQSAVGVALQTESLEREAQSSGKIMSWVGWFNIAWGVVRLLIALGSASADPDLQREANFLMLSAFIQAGLGAAFLGLRHWTYSAPLPATITALVLYVTVNVVEIASSEVEGVAFVYRGLYYKVVIVGFLCKAIAAGIKHRELTRSRAVPA